MRVHMRRDAVERGERSQMVIDASGKHAADIIDDWRVAGWRLATAREALWAEFTMARFSIRWVLAAVILAAIVGRIG